MKLLDKDMDNVLTYVSIYCIIFIGEIKWTLSRTMSKRGGIINAQVGCQFQLAT